MVLNDLCTRYRDIYGPARAVKGSRMDQHTSGQMQSYIRPLGEDLPESSGPDEICASSPDHYRGLRGPVPTQVNPRHGFLYIYAECSRLCPEGPPRASEITGQTASGDTETTSLMTSICFCF